MAGLAVGLSGCGESLTSIQSAEIVSGSKPQAAVLGAANVSSPTAMGLASKTPIKGGDPIASLSGSQPTLASADPKTVTEAFVAVTTPGNTAYKIGPEDVLDVSVFKVPELSRSVQVADGGTVNLPLVGEIQAAGKTSRDIELDLTKKLGSKYLQSPQVTVYVKEYNSQRVTVEGAVKKPGVYPIRGKSSLLQMIANAGGFDELADQSAVIIVRQTGGKRFAGKFDLKILLCNKEMSSSLILQMPRRPIRAF
jgi:polysaccharide biosynthesis/export protein